MNGLKLMNSLISNFKNKNHFPHSVLLIETKISNTAQFINDYLKALLCDNNPSCGTCKWCQKIEQHNYYDLIICDGSYSTIKKEAILSIQNQFNRPALEQKGIKIYLIKNVENTSKQAVNSLLKFLEEPPPNTYAILTTKNEGAIVSTITSRCQKLRLPSNTIAFEKLMQAYQIDASKSNILKQLFYNIDNIIPFIESGLMDTINKLGTEMISANNDIQLMKSNLNDFKKLSYFEIQQLLHWIICLLEHWNSQQFLELAENTKHNPNKVMLFNQIMQAIQA